MKWSYEALNPQGKKVRGQCEADSLHAAIVMVEQMNLEVLLVEEQAQSKPSASGWFTRTWSATEKVVWTRQLAGLVDSGFTIEKALRFLLENPQSKGVSQMVHSLLQHVQEGNSLSSGMKAQSPWFDEAYIAVVQAGEQTGALGGVLLQLAEELENTEQLRQKVIGASLYPMIVVFFSIIMVVFLMVYVVPQVANVFAQGNKKLPWLTSMMLMISSFIKQAGGWMFLAGVIAAGVHTYAMKKSLSWKQRVHRAWLKIPVIGVLALKYHNARFSSVLGLLVDAGVPILKALSYSKLTVSNIVIQQDIEEVYHLVREGASLANALQTKKNFMIDVIAFSRIGEQSGQLASMLRRASHHLSSEVQRRAVRLATLLEPLLIVSMGMMVMLIVLSVLMPIMQLNTMIK